MRDRKVFLHGVASLLILLVPAFAFAQDDAGSAGTTQSAPAHHSKSNHKGKKAHTTTHAKSHKKVVKTSGKKHTSSSKKGTTHTAARKKGTTYSQNHSEGNSITEELNRQSLDEAESARAQMR